MGEMEGGREGFFRRRKERKKSRVGKAIFSPGVCTATQIFFLTHLQKVNPKGGRDTLFAIVFFFASNFQRWPDLPPWLRSF